MRAKGVNSVESLRVVSAALRVAGLDPARELAKHGVSLVDGTPGGPMARAAYCALWARVTETVGRDEVGLDVAREVVPGVLGPVEWLAATADTLGDGIRALARYGRSLHSTGHYSIELSGDRARFVYHGGAGESPHRATLDWSFAYLARHVRQAVPGASLVSEIRFQYARPQNVSRVEEAFEAPVQFGTALNEIVLPREVLDQPLPTRDPETHAALETVCRARWAIDEPSALVGRVEAVLFVLLEREQAPEIETVARRLGTSVRSLQRALRDSKRSYRDLLLGARMELARRRLAAPGVRLTEVSYQLGYSEPSALLRAYRQHFGRSWRDDAALHVD